MAERRTIEFVVTREVVQNGAPIKRWLQADGALGEEGSAISFQFYASPTPRDRDRIVKAEHEVYGVKEYVDLLRGIEGARIRLLTLLESEVWPDGERPKAQGKDLIAQSEQLDEAYRRSTSPEKDHLLELTGRKDKIAFWARWSVLGIDLPPGWEKLEEREGLEDETFYAIWNAFTAALEENELGKTEPSRS
jgi:hypothetical protein